MDPWSSFASSTAPESASTSAWALGDVIPDWSDTAPASSQVALENGLERVQRSANVNGTRQADVDDENDPWATAVSSTQEGFTPMVSPEQGISLPKEAPSEPLSFSESNHDRNHANVNVLEDERPQWDRNDSNNNEHVSDSISNKVEDSHEQVSHDIKTTIHASDIVAEDSIRANILDEQKPGSNNEGEQTVETDPMGGESVAPGQEIEKEDSLIGEPNDDAKKETEVKEDLGINAGEAADIAVRPNNASSNPTVIETEIERQAESSDEMHPPTGSKQQNEWETAAPSPIMTASSLNTNQPVSLFSPPEGLDNSDDFAFSNPFAPEPEKSFRSPNELLPDIFPMPPVVDSERDSIAKYFSDSSASPSQLLGHGKALHLSAMLTRPTRQFFTPPPRASTPSRPSSPSSSIYTANSQSTDDGIRVKWKNTEIQSRVQKVVEVWKDKQKEVGRMFDWDNADVQGPTSPTHFAAMETMALGAAMDRGPSNGSVSVSPRLGRVAGSSPVSSKAEHPDISFSWNDEVGAGVWRGTSSSSLPVHAPAQQALNPIPIAGPATATQGADSVDDWGDFTEVDRPSIPTQRPALRLDTKNTSFLDDLADDIWGPALTNGNAAAPSNTTDELSVAPIQPVQPTVASDNVLQPTTVAPTTMKVNTIEDHDDWGALMGSPSSNTAQDGLNDGRTSPQPDQGVRPNPKTDVRTPTATRSSSQLDSSHPKVQPPHVDRPAKHMTSVYIPPPKPSSPSSSMHLSSSPPSSSVSSAADVRSSLSKQRNTTLLPTAPKLTDAKLRDDEIVRKIIESIPDIEYLVD
ncbi:hypothetical protein V1525DRAFT_361805 [Lipomyces kononenkoae]|uniref:Uncharacterized protein n=1 Tax=Lipomyces kononenkoae TaxID=34357 RepID=A0ACC3SZ85_LIPKO